MIKFLGLLLTLILTSLKYLRDRNLLYPKLIKDFRNKLPNKINSSTITIHPYLGINIVDVSTQKQTISLSELNEFFNKLENFNYFLMFFKKYYLEITNNLLRLKNNDINSIDYKVNIDIMKNIIDESKLDFFDLINLKKDIIIYYFIIIILVIGFLFGSVLIFR